MKRDSRVKDGTSPNTNVSVLTTGKKKRTAATNRHGFSTTPTRRGGVLSTPSQVSNFYTDKLVRFFRPRSFSWEKRGSLAKITFNAILNKSRPILRDIANFLGKLLDSRDSSFFLSQFPKDETWLREFQDDSWSMSSPSLDGGDLSRGLKPARNSASITSLSPDGKDFART